MRATNASTEPLMYSPRMLHVSFAETMSMQLSSCSTVIVSPATMLAVLPSLARPLSADSVAVTESLSESLPSSMASNTSSAVIIFVSEAG